VTLSLYSTYRAWRREAAAERAAAPGWADHPSTSQAYRAMGLHNGPQLPGFVVSHEVIPETHSNGHQTPATLGPMGGFALMMMLDTALD
jgi:hypothetical protein